MESRTHCDSAQRAQKSTAVPGQGEGTAAADTTGLRGAPLSREEGVGAGLYLFNLPIARLAGGDSALCLPPSSFPIQAPQKS